MQRRLFYALQRVTGDFRMELFQQKYSDPNSRVTSKLVTFVCCNFVDAKRFIFNGLTHEEHKIRVILVSFSTVYNLAMCKF